MKKVTDTIKHHKSAESKTKDRLGSIRSIQSGKFKEKYISKLISDGFIKDPAKIEPTPRLVVDKILDLETAVAKLSEENQEKNDQIIYLINSIELKINEKSWFGKFKESIRDFLTILFW